MSQIRLYVDERGRCALHTRGFSWLAAFLPAIWAFQRRLFLVAAITLVYAIGVSILIVTLHPAVQALVLAGQVAVFGGLANRAHEGLLQRRGYRLTAEESPGPDAPPGKDSDS